MHSTRRQKMNLYPTLTNSRPEFKKIPEKLNEHLAGLCEPHLDSFNEFLRIGLRNIAKHMTPLQFQTSVGERIELSIVDINIARPQIPFDVIDALDRNVYPADSRQLHSSYTGMCTVRVSCKVNGLERTSMDVDVGQVAIMLKSSACNLGKLSPEDMVKRGEHDSEFGGIFVVKGNEKIIRMLLMSRRNYPIAVKRPSWKERGVKFSDLGIMVRTVRMLP